MWRYEVMEPSLSHRNPIRPEDAASVYQRAAWQAPSGTRFDNRPANDWRTVPEAPSSEADGDHGVPNWLIVVAGALIASLLAVFAANAMAL